MKRIVAIVVLLFVIAAPALSQLQAAAGARPHREHQAGRVRTPTASLPSAPSAVATTLTQKKFQNPLRQNYGTAMPGGSADQPIQPDTMTAFRPSALNFSFRPNTRDGKNSEPGNLSQSSQSVSSERVDHAVGRYLFRSLPDVDPNYHPVETGSFWQRSGYAISRVLVGRSGDGRTIPKGTYLVGAMVLSLLATADRPDHPYDHHNPSDALGNFGSTVGGDAGMNLLHEFWPQLRHQLAKHASRPVQNIGNSLRPKFVPAH